LILNEKSADTLDMQLRSELEDERNQIRTILESAPDPVVIIDERGIIQGFNAASVQAFGYPADQVIGNNVGMLMGSPDRELHDSYLGRYAQTGEARIIGKGREVMARRRDGTLFPARLAVSEACVGTRRLFTGFLQNLSAQKEAEAQLKEEREQLRSILETAPDPVIVIDERGLIQSFNVASVKTFGYAADEVVGKSVSILMPSPDRERHDSYLARYMDTGVAHIVGIGREVMARRKDGTTFPARLAISEARIGDRRVFTGFLQNLTAEKRAEEALIESSTRLRETQAQLYHASRHGDLGEMASAIAHELNQPLTAILNYVQTSKEMLEGVGAGVPEKVRDFMARTAAQADRAGTIIRRLRQLYERGDADAVPDDLNEAVSEALDLALIGVKESGIQVELRLDKELPEVLMDRQQIQQVVINLVRNAMEAMQAVSNRQLIIHTGRAAADAVELSVCDTGPGLPEEIAKNLFAPFQTTKPAGMGLGLSICRSIIEAHGGKIWVTPTDGGGTTFHFTLMKRG
jgi:two-component system sensor kinase FixL